MFRRKESSLPADFHFPDNLTGLGYFINEKDQIRMIENPNHGFHFFISKNERYVQRHREAMDECIRRIVQERVLTMGFKILRLPHANKPYDVEVLQADQPHSPIWYSNNLATCKRVYIYFGETNQDIGILSGRRINEVGIDEGSIVKFIKLAQRSSSGEDLPDGVKPGIVIANPGQLLWRRRTSRALTWKSWYAIERESAVGPGVEVCKPSGHIPNNETPVSHIECLLRDVMFSQDMKAPPEMYIIAAGNMAEEFVEWLKFEYSNDDDSLIGTNCRGLAILAAHPWHIEPLDDGLVGFAEFFSHRARAYVLSSEQVGTPLSGRTKMGCNVYSSGEDTWIEQEMCKAQGFIVDYFRLLSMNPEYVNEPQIDDDEIDEDASPWGPPSAVQDVDADHERNGVPSVEMSEKSPSTPEMPPVPYTTPAGNTPLDRSECEGAGKNLNIGRHERISTSPALEAVARMLDRTTINETRMFGEVIPQHVAAHGTENSDGPVGQQVLGGPVGEQVLSPINEDPACGKHTAKDERI